MTLPSGIALSELSDTIRPQDDLYRHVNARWLERTPIPADKARYGAFHILAERAEEAVRAIAEECRTAPQGSEARKVGDLYASFMDVGRLEALGAEPIADALAEAAAVASVDEFTALVGRLERGGVPGFLGLGVEVDPGDPGRYIVWIGQAGLGLPNESYYREEQFAGIRDRYREHLARMLALAGLAQPEASAARVFELETRIAAVHWDVVRTRDIQQAYNLRSFAQLQELTPALAWPPYLAALGAPADALAEVVVAQPSAVEGIAALLTEQELGAWRDWLAWQLVRSFAPYLTEEFAKANFDFYGTVLTGTPEQRVRWKRGVSFIEDAMGDAVGKLYVERHFDQTAKAAMDELVANLLEAYRESISSLDWMGPQTRAKALEKLERFTPKIGYPVKWRDYSALEVDPADLVGNARRVAAFATDWELGKIGKPIDRDEWHMTPQTVNAYYHPLMNEIVFPAAILQPPFFDAGRDPAANYGAIGAVIGHEIGHGFDDQGSRYDGDGKLQDWWTQEDRAAFEHRTRSLIEQYDELVPAQGGGQHVNGSLTIGENIGDLGGLGIAWKAYLRSLGEAEPEIVDGLTAERRFFLSWAQIWQQAARDEEVVRLLAIDPHSPAEFRCNQIVRNIGEFYAAFDVTPGDGLWLDPDRRVTIW